jgi:hypothetical protein
VDLWVCECVCVLVMGWLWGRCLCVCVCVCVQSFRPINPRTTPTNPSIKHIMLHSMFSPGPNQSTHQAHHDPNQSSIIKAYLYLISCFIQSHVQCCAHRSVSAGKTFRSIKSPIRESKSLLAVCTRAFTITSVGCVCMWCVFVCVCMSMCGCVCLLLCVGGSRWFI